MIWIILMFSSLLFPVQDRPVDKSVNSGYCMELPNYQLRAIRGNIGKTIERVKTIESGVGRGK